MSQSDIANGASGSAPRDECIDAVDAIWNRLLMTKGSPAALTAETPAIQAEGAIAIASALLHIGDQVAALVNETRWTSEHDEDSGPMREFREALNGPKTRKADR